MESETWRDLPGYEGRYMVSDKGRVMKDNGDLLRVNLMNDYFAVSLYDGHKWKPKTIHSLVALTFLGVRPIDSMGYPFVVNHKDGNKTNNRLENLEYITTWENTTHYHEVLKPMRKR